MNTTPKRPVLAFLIMILAAFSIYALSFVRLPWEGLLSYGAWMEKAARGDALARIAYVFSDFGDPTFQKSALGSLLMIFGVLAALKTPANAKTFGVAYGSGKILPILASQLLSSAGSLLLFGHLLSGDYFLPTFIGIASVPPVIVLMFGSTWYKVLTAGVLGIFLGTPLGYFLNVHFVSPYGLPAATAWVTTMVIGGIIAIEVSKVLPWMTRPETKSAADAAGKSNPGEMNGKWFVKRVFADFTEPIFFGNELAGFLFVLGGLLSWFLSPQLTGYGSGSAYPAILASQQLSVSIAIFLYWPQWHKYGFYNTFAPLASVTPMFIMYYGTGLQVLLAGSLFGAILMPPLAHGLGEIFAKRWHPFLGNVAAMFLGFLLFTAVTTYLPGFGA